MGETLPQSSAPKANEAAEHEPVQKTPLDRALELATRRESLHALGEENLRKAFVENYTANVDGSVSGKFVFHGNNNHEKWIGLKHVIPSEYASVTVTSPTGEIIEGTRRTDGSFYDRAGKYVAVWEGYSFRATAKKPESSPQSESPSPQLVPARGITPPLERPRESISALTEVPISQTVFVGDSLSVAMLHPDVKALAGSYGSGEIKRDKRGNIVEIGAASGGKQTGFMLRRMQSEIGNWQRAGIKRVVIFGGVNDIGSQKLPAQVEKNLKAMYRLAHDAGMQVVACTIPDWNPLRTMKEKDEGLATRMTQRTIEVNQWILSRQGTGAEGPDTVVDLYTQTADRAQFPRSPDQLHFAWKGSKNMAKLIIAQGNIRMG